MSSICLIDTSIFLGMLNVPHYNQHTKSVLEDFETYLKAGCTFLLPMATILETGNHIAQNGDGTMRRETAQRFVELVEAAFTGKAPWTPTQFFETAEILEWINQFPDMAGKNKAPDKLEGTSFGDLSIIQEYHKACNKFSMSDVFIWSLDSDLQNYHQQMPR
jgi:hypothetical protein